MDSFCVYKPTLYRGTHELKSDHGASSAKVITIYKPQEAHLKELVIDITDDNKPFTLYTMKLSKSDFIHIKNAQGLTSEFSFFPDKLISLLEQTTSENTRMYVYIEEDKTNVTLSIREESTIKHVTHLSLVFQHGSESEIKDKVMGYIAKLQKNLQSAEKAHKEMSELASSLQDRLDRRENEISNLKDRHRNKLEEMEQKFMSQISAVEQNKKQVVNDLHGEYQEKLRVVTLDAKNDNEDIMKTLKSLEIEKNILLNDNDTLKSRLQETVNKADSLEQELKQVQKDLHTVRIKLSNNQSELSRKQHSIDLMKKQVEQLEKVLSEKQLSEEHLQSRVEEAVRSINILREQLSQTTSQLRSEQSELKNIQNKYKIKCCDLNKGNEIIFKLQNDLRAERSHQSQVMKHVVELQTSESNIKETCKKLNIKVEEAEKKLEKCQEDCKARNEELQNLKVQKLNLQETLSSVYKELFEYKQRNNNTGTAQEFGSKNMEGYFYRKYLEESTSQPNIHPLPPPSESYSIDQHLSSRDTGKSCLIEKENKVPEDSQTHNCGTGPGNRLNKTEITRTSKVHEDPAVKKTQSAYKWASKKNNRQQNVQLKKK